MHEIQLDLASKESWHYLKMLSWLPFFCFPQLENSKIKPGVHLKKSNLLRLKKFKKDSQGLIIA